MNLRTLALAAGLVAPAMVHGQAVNTNTSRSNTQHNITITCKGPGGGPCTGKQVDEIAQGLSTGRRSWKPLATVKNVSLGGPDGTLKCEQNNGKPCTEEQIQALTQLAAKTQCRINYNSSKSNVAPEK